MREPLLLLLLLLLATSAPAAAHERCDPSSLLVAIDRAKEAREEFLIFESIDAREARSDICRYMSRLSTTLARVHASSDCLDEAGLRIGLVAQRLLDDARRMRVLFELRQHARPGGAELVRAACPD